MKYLLLLLTISLSPFAWSGGVNSGGGYVVACQEEGKTNYEFLDFYEAKEMIRDFELKALPEGTDPFEVAKLVIDRISTFSPQLAKEWKQTVSDFKSPDMTFVKKGLISDIADAEMLFIPDEKCKKQQAAVQLKDPAENQYRLYVDKTIWEGMDMLGKVGLLVHEAIYKTAMAQGHVKSNLFRPITALLFSTGLETKKDYEIALLFKKAELDGCFIKNFEYSNYGEETPYTKFQMPLEIGKFQINKERTHITAVTCEPRGSIQKFFNEGNLSYQAGTVVLTNPSVFCIEDGKNAENNYPQKEKFTFYKLEGKQAIRMEGRICLGGDGKNKIQSARKTPLLPVFFETEAVKINSCEDQYFDKGEIKSCGKITGQLTIAGNPNQVLELESFSRNSYLVGDVTHDLQIYAIAEKYRRLTISGVSIPLARTVNVDPGLNIYLHNIDKDQKIMMNGVECRLDARARLVFDQSGQFKGVLPYLYNKEEIKADSCVKLFQ